MGLPLFKVFNADKKQFTTIKEGYCVHLHDNCSRVTIAMVTCMYNYRVYTNIRHPPAVHSLSRTMKELSTDYHILHIIADKYEHEPTRCPRVLQ